MIKKQGFIGGQIVTLLSLVVLGLGSLVLVSEKNIDVNNLAQSSDVYGCTVPEAENYDSSAIFDDGSCKGCTNPDADNYVGDEYVSLITEEGSCFREEEGGGGGGGDESLSGCTDPNADNYDPNAEEDDESCSYYRGCLDPSANNYNASATQDDGSCTYDELRGGCLSPHASNYDPTANISDGSCIYDDEDDGGDNDTDQNQDGCALWGDCGNDGPHYGCTDSQANNYDSNADSDDGTCRYGRDSDVSGCTDLDAINFNENANTDDGTCRYRNEGCTDSTAQNYEPSAELDDGSCTYRRYGCTDSTATNYNSSADAEDGSCTYAPNNTPPNTPPNTPITPETPKDKEGCTDRFANNYDAEATVSDGSCIYKGCTDSRAENYDALNNEDDGSCTYREEYQGCTDDEASNFDPIALEDDGSCEYDDGRVYGCMDSNALNYKPSATRDDGSCDYFACDPQPPKKMVYVRLTRYAYPGDPTGGGHLDTNNNNLIPNSVGGVGSAAADTNIIPSGSIIETPDGLTLVNHDYGPDVNSKEATKSNSAIDEIKNIYGGGVNPKDTKEFDSPVIDVYDPNNENKDNTNKWTWVCVSPGNEPTKNNGSPKISKNNLKDIFDKAKKLSDERKGETPPSKEDPPNDQQPPQNSTPPNLGDDNLGRGSDGQNVSDLQNFLKENGYLDPDSPNGHFGPLTEEAVKAFQADHGLTPDGVVGPQTKDAIYNQFQNTPPASVAPTNAPGFADNNVQNNFFAPNNLADLGKNIINTSFNGLNNFINNTVSFFGDIFGKNKDPKNKETSITKKDPIPFKVDNKPIYGCTSPTACNYNPKATTGYDSCIFCNVIATTLIEKNSPPQTEAPTGEVASNKFSLADVREAVVENKESLQKEFDEEIKHQEEQANLNFAEKTLGNLFSKRFWKSTLIPNSCNPYFTKNLAPGDFDSEVSEVIAFINTTVGKNLVETPGYDDKVVSAVKEFQLMFYDQILLPNNQTEPNGIWDDITRATANNILGCTEKVKTESLGKITPTITEKPSPEAETKVSEEIKISFEAPIREVVVECRTQQGAHTYKSADPSFVQKITSGEVSACSIYDSVVKKDTPKTTNNCTSVNVLSAQGSLVTKGCVETSQSSTSASFDNNSTKNSVFNSISF